MNAQSVAAANKVLMFANVSQNIFVPLEGGNKDAVKVHNELKGKGARIGFGHVKALLDGQEEMFKGFEVVTILTHAKVPQAVPQQAAPVRPPVPSGPQSTAQRSAPVGGGGRGRGRGYEPSGQEIKPLKRGALYTTLMEMLLRPEGATMKEMLDRAGNKTSGGVNDVLSWQIKQRGYGLRFDDAASKYHLVLPKGHTALTYKD